jgi:hypothetical protein
VKKHIPVKRRGSAFACVLVAAWCFQTGTAGLSAESAWSAQSEATDKVVSVSSAAALEDAVARASSGSTIVIAPGTYELSRTLHVRSTVSNLTIKGGSDNAAHVVLVGRGMSNPNFEDVPHGIIVEGGASHITIANLTIRDVYKHAILLREGTRYARIHNVRLLDAGAHLLKADGHLERGGSANSVVEYSTLEYTSTTRDANTGGIVVSGGSGWTIRQNSFRNIQAPTGQLAAPAVLMWQGSRDSTVEANLFVNCQREISLGMQERSPDDHARGVVRSNFIYRDSMLQGDVAILIADSPQSQVLHNTVLTNGSQGTAIEYRFPNTTGTIVKNNLLDRRIVATRGATGISTGNYTQALPSMFVNPAAGNLHLTAGATVLFDQVPVLDDALLDFDGDSRQPGGMADYGADEWDNLRDSSTTGATATASQLEPSTTTTQVSTSPISATTQSSTTTTRKPRVEPEIALPQPWAAMDIGGNFGGSASASAGTFTVRGGGLDIAGNADQFTFVYQLLEGDGDVVVRVASLDGVRMGAKAGLMVRNSLTADAKYAGSFVVGGKGLVFQTRIANGATTTNSGESSGGVPQWLKLVRSGHTFTAFSSTDGSRWNVLGTEMVYLDQRVYVGLAVASRSKRGLSTAKFTDVTVTPAGTTTTNKAPTVAIATPSSGASYGVSDQIDIAATAGDADGSVAKVEFYSGSTLIGTSATGPFRCTWTNASAGRHALKAVAYDDDGAATASAPVEVDVAAPVNQPPAVFLTTPATGASYSEPASITMSASASDSDGTIAKVEFFAGTNRLGSDSSSPYSVVWSGAAPGTYSLTAVAWDEDGASVTSAPVSVSVRGNLAPSVSLTGPKAGATYTAPATVTFTAIASDADGSVARVEFLVLGVLIGSDATSPYSYSVSGLTDGVYSLTARAVDVNGAATTSAPVSITVNPAPLSGERTLLFHPSADHAVVTSYRVEIFVAGANPLSAAPVRAQDIGKPTPVNGDIATDVSAMVNGLPAGEYYLSVIATSSAGASRSAPSATFVR